jgi:cytochrome c oxidase assembly factor CtaG
VAPSVWYRSYEATAARALVDALGDQQLAGLVMWVPSGVVFIVIGLALVAAWVGESERRVRLGTMGVRRAAGAGEASHGPEW